MAVVEYRTDDGRIFRPGDEVLVRFPYEDEGWEEVWQPGTVVEGAMELGRRVPVWTSYHNDHFGTWYFRGEDVRLARAADFA